MSKRILFPDRDLNFELISAHDFVTELHGAGLRPLPFAPIKGGTYFYQAVDPVTGQFYLQHLVQTEGPVDTVDRATYCRDWPGVLLDRFQDYRLVTQQAWDVIEPNPEATHPLSHTLAGEVIYKRGVRTIETWRLNRNALCERHAFKPDQTLLEKGWYGQRSTTNFDLLSQVVGVQLIYPLAHNGLAYYPAYGHRDSALSAQLNQAYASCRQSGPHIVAPDSFPQPQSSYTEEDILRATLRAFFAQRLAEKNIQPRADEDLLPYINRAITNHWDPVKAENFDSTSPRALWLEQLNGPK